MSYRMTASVRQMLSAVFWLAGVVDFVKYNQQDATFLILSTGVIKKDGLKEPVPVLGGMAWTVNGASTRARQLVAVFQVLCSLYGLTCVGHAQNCPEFFSRSPLIHPVGRSFCLYTDSLFAQIGDSNDKRSSSLEVECWNEDETHAARQLATRV